MMTVCQYCPKLRLLEVPPDPAVSDSSLSFLHKDCKVVRVDPPPRKKSATFAPDAIEPAEAKLERLRRRSSEKNEEETQSVLALAGVAESIKSPSTKSPST